MEVDSDLLSAILRTDIDYWGADKKQTFLMLEDEKPVIDGGLSTEEIDRIIQGDWVLEETKKDVPEWPVGFGTDILGEIRVKWGLIAKGTPILRSRSLDIDLVPQ